MSGCWRFVLVGLRQAGWVMATAVVMVVAVGLAMTGAHVVGLSGNTMWRFGGFGIEFLVVLLMGPGPHLLIRFDLSDRALLALTVALIPLYWCCLGAGAGLLQWRIWKRLRHETQDASQKRVYRRTRAIVGTIAVLVAGLTFFFLGPIGGSAYVRSGPSLQSHIIYNLRLIDTAKQQFALEKHLSAEYVPTIAELTPYFERSGITFRPVGPERYVLNSMDKLPYAVLDSDWKEPRVGWRDGRTIRRGVYRLD